MNFETQSLPTPIHQRRHARRRRPCPARILERPRRVRRSAHRSRRAQTEGPFYPDRLPLDTDNDLLDRQRRHHAGGRRDHAPHRPHPRRRTAIRSAMRSSKSGRSTATASTCTPPTRTPSATPTSRASAASSPAPAASTTSARSSRCPTPAARRTFISRSSGSGQREFTTQCYVKGHPQNERDGVYRGIRDAKAREAVTRRLRADSQTRSAASSRPTSTSSSASRPAKADYASSKCRRRTGHFSRPVRTMGDSQSPSFGATVAWLKNTSFKWPR